MLGVIFFVGLKISTVDMIDTANNYYNEANFYDYNLVSSVGISTEDIYEIREDARVFAAEGAYYQDMIVSDNNKSNYVVRIHSITEIINKLKVVDGRLPETADECVVDSRYYDSSYIGEKIIVSDSNSEDSLENIVYKELTITGLVDSPLYLSYQRGTTSIGSGSINSFIYVNYECFAIDYFTEIYIDVEDGYYIFSNDYDSLIDERQAQMEELSEMLAKKRYDELTLELENGKAEYLVAQSDYEQGMSYYNNALSDYEQSKFNNDNNKLQLESLKEYHEELINQKQSFLDAYDYSKAANIENQIKGVESFISKLETEIYATDAELEQIKIFLDETKLELDEAYIKLEENADITEKELPPLASYALTRGDNLGYYTYEDNANIVASIAYIFPVFFVLVASFVCITTMSRMVEEERTQIGVFKALGYSQKKILGKYIFYSLSAATLGSILGFYAGSFLFPTVIWKGYMVMYTYTDTLNIIHDYSLFLLSFVVSAIVLVGSTVFSCYRVLKETPAEMIRPKAPEPGKRVLLERVKGLWSRLPFLHKVSIRNCFRYKKRFIMMLIGIAGCTALLIIGFGLQDSISSVCNDQYDRIELYDYLVSVKEDLSGEEFAAIDRELENCSVESLNVSMNSADISYNGKKKEISLITSDDVNELEGFINLHDDNGKIGLESSKGCLISSNLAESLDVSVGNNIKISFENLQEFEYTIEGIYENFIGNYVVLTSEGYTAGAGENPYQNCLLVNSLDDQDIYVKLTKLSEIENVSGVSATEISRDYFNKVIKSLDAIVYLVILCAAVLAFVVLYNLNNINIMERTREIATIKVLGFYRNETAGYVFRENVILTILGTLCGLPLGYVMHGTVMSKIKIDMVSFDIHIDTSSYLISAGLTFLFSILVEQFMRRKITRVNMSESLKSIE